MAQLRNLHNFTTYKLAVSAVTKSTKAPGKLYESQFSSYNQIFVSPGCTVPSEMVSVFARYITRHEKFLESGNIFILFRDGINMVMVAVVLAVITSILIILGLAVCCRRKGFPHHELVSVLSPTKYLTSARAGLRSASRGWRGESASDIPAPLFPKHVQVI